MSKLKIDKPEQQEEPVKSFEEMYKDTKKALSKNDIKVDLVLGTTEEDVNWMRSNRKRSTE